MTFFEYALLNPRVLTRLIRPRTKTLNQLAPVRNVKKNIHLVETSHALRKAQADTLSNHAVVAPKWHDSLDSISLDDEVYTMVVAHEFFDALPFHLLEVLPFAFLPITL